MDFDRFSDFAVEVMATVPPEYLSGIAGVEVHRRSLSHPHLEGYFTLGECGDDEVTALTDPAALRSRIHLYYGSFRSLSRKDPCFDWREELRETILHEIRHHLEDRAGILDLLQEDALDEALAAWKSGLELPERWYRAAEDVESDVFRVGDDLFVELRLRAEDVAKMAGSNARVRLLGDLFDAGIPEGVRPGEILTFEGEGMEGVGGRAGDLHLVLGSG